jgi:hypothetical protein
MEDFLNAVGSISREQIALISGSVCVSILLAAICILFYQVKKLEKSNKKFKESVK